MNPARHDAHRLKDIPMSSLKYLGGSVFEPPRPFHDAARRLAATGLRRASAALARLSRRLGRRVASTPHPDPQLEFYAEAGAPEGALYLDGKLVGWVPGLKRL